MYRPPNWAEIKRKLCNEKLKDVGGADCETCPADPQTCDYSAEAAVDAFLQELRTVSLSIGGQKIEIPGHHLALIPDDE